MQVKEPFFGSKNSVFSCSRILFKRVGTFLCQEQTFKEREKTEWKKEERQEEQGENREKNKEKKAVPVKYNKATGNRVKCACNC